MLPSGRLDKIPERRFEQAALFAAGVFYAAGSFVPWGWPSVDGYPAIERFIDPTFLTNDFYTNTTTAYNVDTLLAAALSAAQKATGVKYDIILAALNLLRCLLWPMIFFQFLRALSGDRRLALIGALIGAGSLFALPNLFAWGWLWGDPSTAMFAVLFATAGWTAFLDRRPAMAMGYYCFALLIHPLMAVHGGVFVALIFFIDYAREEKIAALKSPSAWLAGLVFVGLFLFQYLLLGATPDEKLPTDAYTRILAYVRHPTDFIPSLFSASDWIAGLAGSAGALAIAWKMRGTMKRRRLVAAGLASYFIICFCGWLFVEIHPVRFFVELIPFRYVIVGAPLMLFVFATLAAAELREGRYAAFLGLSALFFAATPASRLDEAPVAVSVTLAGWAFFRLFAGRAPTAPIDKFIAARASPSTLLTALALTLLILSPAAIYLRRHELLIPRAHDQHSLYRWAMTQTPADAVFLVDQNGAPSFSHAIDPQRLRLVGRRAVVASKDFPFLDSDIAPWNERWQTALGGGAARFVSKAGAGALAEIAAKYSFDYIVRDAPLDDPRFALAETFRPEKGASEIFVYRRAAP